MTVGYKLIPNSKLLSALNVSKSEGASHTTRRVEATKGLISSQFSYRDAVVRTNTQRHNDPSPSQQQPEITTTTRASDREASMSDCRNPSPKTVPPTADINVTSEYNSDALIQSQQTNNSARFYLPVEGFHSDNSKSCVWPPPPSLFADKTNNSSGTSSEANVHITAENRDACSSIHRHEAKKMLPIARPNAAFPSIIYRTRPTVDLETHPPYAVWINVEGNNNTILIEKDALSIINIGARNSEFADKEDSAKHLYSNELHPIPSIQQLAAEDDSSTGTFESSSSSHCSTPYTTPPILNIPLPPTPYDGRADPDAFILFVQESWAYIIASNIPYENRIEELATYLTGDAHAWYTRAVLPYSSSDTNSTCDYRSHTPWTVEQFFSELAIQFFPKHYVSSQSRAYNNASQRPAESAYTYARRLGNLMALSGVGPYTTAKDRSARLFEGFRLDVRERLIIAFGLERLDQMSWKYLVSAACEMEGNPKPMSKARFENKVQTATKDRLCFHCNFGADHEVRCCPKKRDEVPWLFDKMRIKQLLNAV